MIQNSLPATVELIVTPAELVCSDPQVDLFVDFVTKLQLLLLRESASSTAEVSLSSEELPTKLILKFRLSSPFAFSTPH